MESIESVKLLDDNRTVQPFKPVYGPKFAQDVNSWDGDDLDKDDSAPRGWASHSVVERGMHHVSGGNYGATAGPAIDDGIGAGHVVTGVARPAKPTKKKFKYDTIYARDLNIKYGSDERYWKWKRILGVFEVAELKQINEPDQLEVTGKYEMRKLVPGFRYNFDFVIKKEENLFFNSQLIFQARLYVLAGNGWHAPENAISKTVDIMAVESRTNQLIHVPLGDYEASVNGEVNFSLTLISRHPKFWLSRQPQYGLTVVGVNVSPSTKSTCSC